MLSLSIKSCTQHVEGFILIQIWIGRNSKIEVKNWGHGALLSENLTEPE